MPISTASEQSFGGLPRSPTRSRDSLQTGYFNYCPSETWTPNVNLYEVEGGYLVCVDLSGVEKDEIDIVAEQSSLRLRGRRLVPRPPDYSEAQRRRMRVHLMEIDHGAFCRVVELPADVDHNRISAQHRNGLLWIELPRK